MKTNQINQVDVCQLKSHPRNPRTHSPRQIQQIARSIREFGFTNPILIDNRKNIVAGHGRVAAAKQLGFNKIPTITLAELTRAQLRAYVIADNKLAENAGWDEALLKLEFQYLHDLEVNLDLSITGFELPEIDFFLSDINETEAEPSVPSINDREIVTQPGDLWQLGDHFLLCGDFLHQHQWKKLMGRKRAQMIFADPPYNVPIEGHVSGLGKHHHEKFAMACGEMSEEDFTEYLISLFFYLSRFSKKSALHYICMDWRHQYELLTAARDVYHECKNLCIWNKTNGGMGSLYRSKHELIYVFKSGDAPHINNVELGKYGRYRTNVWDYAGNNAFHSDRNKELGLHPTCKPVVLVADAILDCTHRDHIVVDPCVGAGTTLLAAEHTQRRAYVMEIDPKYVDISILRWQEMTGKQGIHIESGRTFSQIKAIRCHKENSHDYS